MNGEADISLVCSVKINYLDSNGLAKRSIGDQKTNINLVRNEFRDIILKITSPKINFSYALKDITLHTRFVKEGKATIKVSQPNVQVFISNCPPNKLTQFLKVALAKTEQSKSEKNVVSAKQRLLSQRQRSLEEISPLTALDVNVLRNKLKPSDSKTSSSETPKSSKRKHEGLESQLENATKKISVTRPLSSTILTLEQRHVLSAVMSGRNVFFTGSAGTGKSFLLKRIIGALAPEHTYATASTGVAASEIGGITLHSFAGIGTGNSSLQQCVAKFLQKGKDGHWKKCRHLIVDEISMVDGELFKKLECLARMIRNNDKPFGGIQLILSGDFLQLPPVWKPGEDRKFCFQTSAWRKCIDINIELTHVKRQKDQDFINILQCVRKGQCNNKVIEKLKATLNHVIDREGIVATRLSTHKDDVNFINESRLKMLTGKSRIYHATDNEPSLSTFISNHCPVEEKLELKVGAQVMLTKNLDVQKGLVNGTRGVIAGFENGDHGLPIVKFISGRKMTVDYEKWSVKAASGVVLTRKMLPLKHAWAMSIHKSQGMTLDCVEVSLARVFECGQAYVALSRAKSLEGLRVLDIEAGNIRADPQVLKFYSELQTAQFYRQTEMNEYS